MTTLTTEEQCNLTAMCDDLDVIENAKTAIKALIEAFGPEASIQCVREQIEEAGRTRTPCLLNQAHYGCCVMALEDAQKQIREDAEEAQFEFDAYTR